MCVCGGLIKTMKHIEVYTAVVRMIMETVGARGWEKLPPEILMMIVGYMDLNGGVLLRLREVCKEWKDVVDKLRKTQWYKEWVFEVGGPMGGTGLEYVLYKEDIEAYKVFELNRHLHVPEDVLSMISSTNGRLKNICLATQTHGVLRSDGSRYFPTVQNPAPMHEKIQWMCGMFLVRMYKEEGKHDLGTPTLLLGIEALVPLFRGGMTEDFFETLVKLAKKSVDTKWRKVLETICCYIKLPRDEKILKVLVDNNLLFTNTSVKEPPGCSLTQYSLNAHTTRYVTEGVDVFHPSQRSSVFTIVEKNLTNGRHVLNFLRRTFPNVMPPPEWSIALFLSTSFDMHKFCADLLKGEEGEELLKWFFSWFYRSHITVGDMQTPFSKHHRESRVDFPLVFLNSVMEALTQFRSESRSRDRSKKFIEETLKEMYGVFSRVFAIVKGCGWKFTAVHVMEVAKHRGDFLPIFKEIIIDAGNTVNAPEMALRAGKASNNAIFHFLWNDHRH